jgi:hypothetical protein
VPIQQVLLDDRLLIEELLVGSVRSADIQLGTTAYWYFRACRAAMAAGGGKLSGPFEALDVDDQERAVLSLLELRDDISLPDPRVVVPTMAALAVRHPRLNLLNLEAVAAGRVESAIVWLSAPSARGVLPEVLEAEEIAWTMIDVA